MPSTAAGPGWPTWFHTKSSPPNARAASVTVEAQPELLPLLQGTYPISFVPFDRTQPLPPSECDIEIMELGFALRLPPGTTHGFVTEDEPLELLDVHTPGCRPDRDTYFVDTPPAGFGPGG